MFKRIEPQQVHTSRLQMSYLIAGRSDKPVLMLIHGNTSSNLFYLDLIDRLKDDYYIIAPDLRGYGKTQRLPINATNGLKDWSEDLFSLLVALNIKQKAHWLGWSMGGGVIIQLAIDHPEVVGSLTLVNPLSPFGYSGTKDLKGTPNNEDYSGTGGGTVNQNFVKALKEKDYSLDNPTSVPNVLKMYFAPEFKIDPEIEQIFLESMTEMAIGEDFYPGNFLPSTYWPNVKPGDKGIANAMSPKYVNLTKLLDGPKVPILYLSGAKDMIVSDTCLLDIGYLGKLGYVPGWPGEDNFPPHAMVSQTKAFLNEYQARGGRVETFVFENSGHGPMIEEPELFVEKLKTFAK